jgi:transposase-like protein
MRLVPRVSSAEIQPLAQERLAAEAVIKTDGRQGYSFLDASSDVRHEWLVPGSGKEAPKVLPWVHTLIVNIKGNIRGIHHGVSPKHLPRYLAEFYYRFNKAWTDNARDGQPPVLEAIKITPDEARIGGANIAPSASRHTH